MSTEDVRTIYAARVDREGHLWLRHSRTGPWHFGSFLYADGVFEEQVGPTRPVRISTAEPDEAAIAIERLVEGLESRNAYIADTGQSRERDVVRAALAHIDNLCRIVNRHTGADQTRAADRALDSAMYSVWLHGDWRWLTTKMTTEEREAAADAVDRHKATYPPEDGDEPIERWWRDERPAPPPGAQLVQLAVTDPGTVGRCGSKVPSVSDDAAPLTCALPSGHGGWCRADNGAEWSPATAPAVPPVGLSADQEINSRALRDAVAWAALAWTQIASEQQLMVCVDRFAAKIRDGQRPEAAVEVERLRAALKLIGTKCSNFTSGTCADPGSGRTPDAQYLAERWCDECIARVALAGHSLADTDQHTGVARRVRRRLTPCGCGPAHTRTCESERSASLPAEPDQEQTDAH